MGFTGILIVAGTRVVHSSSVGAFDNHITSTVVAHRSDVLNEAMKVITRLGSWVALVVAALLLLALAVRGRLRWLAVLLAFGAWVGEAGAVTLAKHIVQRQRPPMNIWLKTAHGWSWPSGHTATAALVFAVLGAVVTQILSSRVTRVAAWATAAIAVAAVGFSRIELGVHWTTDVVASLAFVSSWVLVIFMLFGAELRDPQRIAQGKTSSLRRKGL
jgi:undecaprenyl-diphosphatase